MKRAPRSGAWINFGCVRSQAAIVRGVCDLRFGAEPVFQLVTVLPTACLVEFLRAGDYLFSSTAMASKGSSLMFSGRCSNASCVRMSPAFARISSVLPSG